MKQHAIPHSHTRDAYIYASNASFTHKHSDTHNTAGTNAASLLQKSPIKESIFSDTHPTAGRATNAASLDRDAMRQHAGGGGGRDSTAAQRRTVDEILGELLPARQPPLACVL